MSVYLCISVVLGSLGLDNVIADNPCTLCTLHTLTLGNEFASGFGAAHHSPAASPQSTAKISTGNRNHQTIDNRDMVTVSHCVTEIWTIGTRRHTPELSDQR